MRIEEMVSVHRDHFAKELGFKGEQRKYLVGLFLLAYFSDGKFQRILE